MQGSQPPAPTSHRNSSARSLLTPQHISALQCLSHGKNSIYNIEMELPAPPPPRLPLQPTSKTTQPY